MKKHTVMAMNATGRADSTRRAAYPNMVLRTYPYGQQRDPRVAPPDAFRRRSDQGRRRVTGLLLGEPPSAVNVLRIVLEALDVGLHDVRSEVVDERNDRDTLHRDPLSFVKQLGAREQIALGSCLVQELVELGIGEPGVVVTPVDRPGVVGARLEQLE